MTGMPIQLYCVISTAGSFTPIRFKYKDEDQCIHTVEIRSVLSTTEMQLGGSRILCLRCHTLWENQLIPVELRYDVTAHRWVFARRLDNPGML